MYLTNIFWPTEEKFKRKEVKCGCGCPYVTMHQFGLVLKIFKVNVLVTKIFYSISSCIIVTEPFSENPLIAVSSTCSVCINDFRQPKKRPSNIFFLFPRRDNFSLSLNVTCEQVRLAKLDEANITYCKCMYVYSHRHIFGLIKNWPAGFFYYNFGITYSVAMHIHDISVLPAPFSIQQSIVCNFSKTN
jgi:hypothetical protein